MANVVIVTDMLRGFHDMGALANPRMKNIIPKVKELLPKKSQDGWTIIFLRDKHDPNDKEFEMFPPHCVVGTKETEIINGLKKTIIDTHNYNFFIVDKTRYSGFFKTKLETLLKIKKPDEIIVVGVCTDICVLYTVADLRQRDYNVTVLKDCVETYDAPDHPAEETAKWALKHMRQILGAKIKELKDVI